MIKEIETLLDRYWAWLRDQTSLRAGDDWVEITTPYLDRHNDCLQIYAKKADHGYVLTDDGYVLDDLVQSGCNVDAPRLRALIDTTLNGFGVRRNGDALEVEVSPTNFAVRKHNLLQAMLAVEDVHYLASLGGQQPPFRDAVDAWLNESKIRYTPNVSLNGRSGLGHRFEFVIPRSELHPERVVRSFNRPNRAAVSTMVFAWIDTRKARAHDSTAYAILNDTDATVSEDLVGAMRSYQVQPVLWSQRDASLEKLDH